MINSLNKSCFTFHITGNCKQLNEKFGIDLADIEKISACSDMFRDELTSFKSMTSCIEQLITDTTINKVQTHFNPEFFPSLPKCEIDSDAEIALLIAEDEAMQMDTENALHVVISKNFDSLGDYVCTRVEYESNEKDIRVECKNLISPDIFARFKQNPFNSPKMVSH